MKLTPNPFDGGEFRQELKLKEGFVEIEGRKNNRSARFNNQEIPQLYPVYPWVMYGIGKPDLDTAINTWKYGTDLPIQKNYVSWHQDAIFCARLGLTDEAAAVTIKKLQDSERRFPTFWGPGHDWVPDHNRGGSVMDFSEGTLNCKNPGK